MVKILFTWELGEGTGHTTPYIKLISQLEARGHQVSFALRSLHKAHDQFGGFKTKWYQAPLVLPRHVNVTMPINSYPKILHNNGYDNAGRLASMIAAWKNLYALIDPDLLVFDYSPTAMLAARGSRARRIAIGTGFTFLRMFAPSRVCNTKRTRSRTRANCWPLKTMYFAPSTRRCSSMSSEG